MKVNVYCMEESILWRGSFLLFADFKNLIVRTGGGWKGRGFHKTKRFKSMTYSMYRKRITFRHPYCPILHTKWCSKSIKKKRQKSIQEVTYVRDWKDDPITVNVSAFGSSFYVLILLITSEYETVHSIDCFLQHWKCCRLHINLVCKASF